MRKHALCASIKSPPAVRGGEMSMVRGQVALGAGVGVGCGQGGAQARAAETIGALREGCASLGAPQKATPASTVAAAAAAAAALLLCVRLTLLARHSGPASTCLSISPGRALQPPSRVLSLYSVCVRAQRACSYRACVSPSGKLTLVLAVLRHAFVPFLLCVRASAHHRITTALEG